MKKYFMMLLSMMFVATMSVGFVSCGDDDEEVVPKDEKTNSDGTSPSSDSNPSEDSESETTLSPEEQKFVGYWHIRVGANSHNFLFLPNGKAVRSEQRYGEEQYTYGEWQYNPKTKLLATTIDMWQFEVTAIFDNSWTGVTVNTGRAVNASKEKEDTYLKQIFKGIEFSDEANPTIYKSVGGWQHYFFECGSKISLYGTSYSDDTFCPYSFVWQSSYSDEIDGHGGRIENIVTNSNKISADVVIVLRNRGIGDEYVVYETYRRSVTISFNIESPTLTIKNTGLRLYQKYKYSDKTLITESTGSGDIILPMQKTFMKEGTYQGKWKH